MGLDRLAGNGGCLRALVLVKANRPTGKPLYRSPHLIGSSQAADTGTIQLAGPGGGQQSLVLVADATHESLAEEGPGRAADGSFELTRFTAGFVPPDA